MQVCRNAYYQYLDMKEPNAREVQLEAQVVEVFHQQRRHYGVRRVCSEMKERGFMVGNKNVTRCSVKMV